MILQQILELFDEELDRLQQLRSIVTGLARPSILPIADALAASVEPSGVAPPPAEKLKRKPRTALARTREPKKTASAASQAPRMTRSRGKVADESSALRGTIPAGPVVVSADRVREQSRSKKDAPKPEPVRTPSAGKSGLGSLGSMIRALRLETSL